MLNIIQPNTHTAIQTARLAAVALCRSASRIQRGGPESQGANHGRTVAAQCRLGAAHLSRQRALVEHSGHGREGCADLDLAGWHRHRVDAHPGDTELLDEFAKVPVRRADVLRTV